MCKFETCLELYFHRKWPFHAFAGRGLPDVSTVITYNLASSARKPVGGSRRRRLTSILPAADPAFARPVIRILTLIPLRENRHFELLSALNFRPSDTTYRVLPQTTNAALLLASAVFSTHLQSNPPPPTSSARGSTARNRRPEAPCIINDLDTLSLHIFSDRFFHPQKWPKQPATRPGMASLCPRTMASRHMLSCTR